MFTKFNQITGRLLIGIGCEVQVIHNAIKNCQNVSAIEAAKVIYFLRKHLDEKLSYTFLPHSVC